MSKIKSGMESKYPPEVKYSECATSYIYHVFIDGSLTNIKPFELFTRDCRERGATCQRKQHAAEGSGRHGVKAHISFNLLPEEISSRTVLTQI